MTYALATDWANLRAENERLRKLAKELSDALLTVAPLGGSECFIRRGRGDSEAYYADPEFFKRRIRENSDRLHGALKRAFVAETALREIADLPDVRADEAATVATRALAYSSAQGERP